MEELMSVSNGSTFAARADRLTQSLITQLGQPAASPDFDLQACLDEVLAEVGMSSADCGGKVSFYGQDPILPSRLRFGAVAAVGLAAKALAVAAIWKDRTDQGQDIDVDVRKALRRFAGFFEGKWETINGRSPAAEFNEGNPFLGAPFFRETRDGRHVVVLSIYPRLRTRALNLLRCSDNAEAVQNAILQWNSDDLETAAAEQGLVIAKIRTNEEFRREPQYTDVLAGMPLISVEKIGESEPAPFRQDAISPLDGIRALGMGHVIAGAAMGRDLAYYGTDVLNIWRPNDTELELFSWDVQVGMRSTILDDSKQDRARFDQLLSSADVFFANKRPGFLLKHGLDAEELCSKKPGLIHATVVLHGSRGPWSNRPGFDEVGAAVSGVFTIEGSPGAPKQPPIVPICDNVVGWLGTIGILAALRRRAIEGGSYRVEVSLTRTVLWMLSLGIFDREYAQATAGSGDAHSYVAPELFTAETPMGTYQGMTDQITLHKSPGAFRTVMAPRGSSKPEWLS
jgi:crotonobetainyl-CoA:carnitine CoA-transferase CaiB-like acyl-CoA transferase